MLLGSMAQNAFAQKIEIKGTVRDASDKSIEYVNVVLQTIDSTFVAGVTTSPEGEFIFKNTCLLYTSPSPRDKRQSRMPSSA